MKIALVAIASAIVQLLLSSCANPINAYTADKYYSLAVAAEQRGDFEDACMLFSRSYGNARMGDLGANAEAHSLYEYARLCGYTGKPEESERGYREVLQLIDKTKEAEPLRAPALVEFSRMLHGTDAHAKAVPVFEAAYSALEDARLSEQDPVGYAIFLGDFADSLQATGQAGKAAEIRAQSTRLFGAHRAERPRFNVTQVYANAGHAAQRRNDWRVASGYFRRSLAIWEKIEGPADAAAFLHYEYGRSLGVLGQFDEARLHLLKALELDRSANGPVMLDLTELARLHFDQGKYADALVYFEASSQLIAASPEGRLDAAESLYLLNEYVICLERAGRTAELPAARSYIQKILSSHPHLQPKADRTPYGKFAAPAAAIPPS